MKRAVAVRFLPSRFTSVIRGIRTVIGTPAAQILLAFFKNGFVAQAGKLPVSFTIHMLDIKEDMVNTGHQVAALVPFEKAAAFHPDRNTELFATGHQTAQKLVLHKRLSARKCHATTGMAEENLVAADLVQNSIGIHRFTGELKCLFRARVHAVSAESAAGKVETFRRRVEPFRADRAARVATFAFVGRDRRVFYAVSSSPDWRTTGT